MKRSMKMALCAGLLGMSTLSLAAPVHAEQCGGNSMAAELLKKHQDKLKELGCKDDKECAKNRQKLFENSVNFWNSLVGNSPLTIGPRRLDFDSDLKGTVINPGERRFISLPIIDYDKMTVSITKQGGQAETELTISKLDAQGKCTELVHEDIPKGTGNYARSFSFDEVRGSVIIVRLTPKGLGRKLEYTLKAKGL